MTVAILGIPVTAQAASNNCGDSLQSLIDAAPAGSTLVVPACVFRETVRIAKPLTLQGQPGSEIRGSDVWSSWNPNGGYWVSELAVPSLPTVGNVDGRCGEATNRCLLPEQVFMDTWALKRAPSGQQPKPGQFALDSGRHVVLADNPARHTIEVSTRTAWVKSQADGITIASMTMRHAANDALTGALSNDGHSNWMVRNSKLSDAHGAVVSMHDATNVRVVSNDISHGGDMGIHGTLVTNGLIENNRIFNNNMDAFNPAWGAGGVKITGVQQFVIDHNQVYSNFAPGLWCDISCSGVTIASNRVHDNTWQGIIYEISRQGSIHDNAVWQNGVDAPTFGFGAGILVSSSAGTEVFNNTLAWNKAGISIIDLNRPDRLQAVNNSVHDNVIVRNAVSGGDSWANLSLAWLTDGTGVLYDPASNNRGSNNRVWYDQDEIGTAIRGSWQQQYTRMADFAQTPGYQGGGYITRDEMVQALSSANVPMASTT
jgi:parallel beta-helix repeat protein